MRTQIAQGEGRAAPVATHDDGFAQELLLVELAGFSSSDVIATYQMSRISGPPRARNGSSPVLGVDEAPGALAEAEAAVSVMGRV